MVVRFVPQVIVRTMLSPPTSIIKRWLGPKVLLSGTAGTFAFTGYIGKRSSGLALRVRPTGSFLQSMPWPAAAASSGTVLSSYGFAIGFLMFPAFVSYI